MSATEAIKLKSHTCGCTCGNGTWEQHYWDLRDKIPGRNVMLDLQFNSQLTASPKLR